jgi:hypothetical protein
MTVRKNYRVSDAHGEDASATGRQIAVATALNPH